MRNQSRLTLLFGFSFLTSLAFAGLASAAESSQGAIRPALIYHNFCSVCHGDKGDGRSHAETSMDPPPINFTKPEVAKGMSRERMINSVTHGLPGTAMAGWKNQLSEQEIAAVVDYVREVFMPAVGAGDVNPGKKIYAHTCSVCHGDDGKSAKWGSNLLAKRPRDFTSEDSRTELSRERMINSVAHGVPQTPMVAYDSQLSRQEIEQVVDYIRIAFMQTAESEGLSGTMAHGKTTSAPAHQAHSPQSMEMGVVSRRLLPAVETVPTPGMIDMKASLPDNLQGNMVNGKALYIQNCVECHGVSGDGEGPRAYFIFPRPRNFNRKASKLMFNRPALYESISKGKLGTEMPAWRTVLTPQQMADLSEYVFQTYIQGQGETTP